MWRLPYLLIVIYRRWFSPLLPSACRFHPSCSAYGAEALKRHGFGYGSWLTIKRVACCHPWHPGGYDPVPPVRDNSVPADDHNGGRPTELSGSATPIGDSAHG